MISALQAQLAALAHMTQAQLKAEWLRVYKAPAPALTADLLARGIAWKLQERALGGLTPATLREVARIAKQSTGSASANVTAGRIKPGTRLVRDWGRSSHHVTVLDRGYLYRDRQYRSLSQIARDITGSHISGPRFFGLTGSSAKEAGRG
jgi:hypothetical protein